MSSGSSFAEMSIPALVQAAAERYGNAEAIADLGPDGASDPTRRRSFSGLAADVRECAAAAIAAGVNPGRSSRGLGPQLPRMGRRHARTVVGRRHRGAAEHPAARRGGGRHPRPHFCDAAGRRGRVPRARITPGMLRAARPTAPAPWCPACRACARSWTSDPSPPLLRRSPRTCWGGTTSSPSAARCPTPPSRSASARSGPTTSAI